MDGSRIDPGFASKLRVQKYASLRRIDGVALHDLRRFVDDAGSFLEVARVEGGRLRTPERLALRQINYAVLAPGTIKAFHLHERQSEHWFVPPESCLLMGLLDVRAGSPTLEVSMRFVLGDGQAQLLFIPAGVAHGVANLSGRPAPMLYLVDQEFDPDPASCDEKRLPWDTLGASFWERERG